MSTQVQHILKLADLFGDHMGITHWAVSMRIGTKGDQLKLLKAGRDIRTRTAEKLMLRLSEEWPADLEWPADIPRPSKSKPKKVA